MFLISCVGSDNSSPSNSSSSSTSSSTSSGNSSSSSSGAQSADLDKDGITDSLDQCLSTRTSSPVDSLGCHGAMGEDSLGCSDIQRGKKEYASQCTGCHGAMGEGGFGGAVNGLCKFTNCQELAVLTTYIHTDMPWKGTEKCENNNLSTCASDIAAFMHDEIVSFKNLNQDSDNDGFIDANDSCPNTPTDKLSSIDDQGCHKTNELTQLVYSINAGGQAYTSDDGQTFRADDFFINGTQTSREDDVKNTTLQDVYKTLRYGDFSYQLTVPNGQYRVTLLLAEPVYNAAGKRVFDIKLEGILAFDNVDIFKRSGGKNSATSLISAKQSVADGQLTIEFVTVTDNAQVNGLLIEHVGNDADQDNILDSAEKCPGTKLGLSVDADGDGLSHDIDQFCPNTLKGESVDLTGDLIGCSDTQKQADSDNDGVKDPYDRCPSSVANSNIDSQGCRLINTLATPKGFTGKGVGNGLELSWQFYSEPVSYWIVQRYDELSSHWETVGRVEGNDNKLSVNNFFNGRFQLYSVKDDIASFPAQLVLGQHDLTVTSGCFNPKVDDGVLAYKLIEGDFDARVTVNIPDNGLLWRWERGGLMARESLDRGSKYVGVWTAAGVAVNGTSRDIANETAKNYLGEFGTLSFPKTVRFTRTGDLFAWYEYDNNAWKKLGEHRLQLSKRVYLGEASCSGKRITVSYKGSQINGEFMQDFTLAKIGNVSQADINNHSSIASDNSIASLRPNVETSRFVHITKTEYQKFVKAIFPDESFDFKLFSDSVSSGYEVGSNISLFLLWSGTARFDLNNMI